MAASWGLPGNGTGLDKELEVCLFRYLYQLVRCLILVLGDSSPPPWVVEVKVSEQDLEGVVFSLEGFLYL